MHLKNSLLAVHLILCLSIASTSFTNAQQQPRIYTANVYQSHWDLPSSPIGRPGHTDCMPWFVNILQALSSVSRQKAISIAQNEAKNAKVCAKGKLKARISTISENNISWLLKQVGYFFDYDKIMLHGPSGLVIGYAAIKEKALEITKHYTAARAFADNIVPDSTWQLLQAAHVQACYQWKKVNNSNKAPALLYIVQKIIYREHLVGFVSYYIARTHPACVSFEEKKKCSQQ